MPKRPDFTTPSMLLKRTKRYKRFAAVHVSNDPSVMYATETIYRARKFFMLCLRNGLCSICPPAYYVVCLLMRIMERKRNGESLFAPRKVGVSVGFTWLQGCTIVEELSDDAELAAK
jgi:hypothetical protein